MRVRDDKPRETKRLTSTGSRMKQLWKFNSLLHKNTQINRVSWSYSRMRIRTKQTSVAQLSLALMDDHWPHSNRAWTWIWLQPTPPD